MTASDRYIQHFEYKEGRVLLYFGEVSKPNDFLILLQIAYRVFKNLIIVFFTLHYLSVIFVIYCY